MRAHRSRALSLAAALYLGVLGVNRSLVRVRGPSMEPHLWEGDLLVTVPAPRWLPWLRRPGRVVVVADPHAPDHHVVKRVWALGPDGVEVRGDDASRSTDSRVWGPLRHEAVRRTALVRWPDVRTPLTRRPVQPEPSGPR